MCVWVECVDVAVYGQCLWNDVAAAALIHRYCLLPIHFEPLRQKVNTSSAHVVSDHGLLLLASCSCLHLSNRSCDMPKQIVLQVAWNSIKHLLLCFFSPVLNPRSLLPIPESAAVWKSVTAAIQMKPLLACIKFEKFSVPHIHFCSCPSVVR